MKHLFLFLCVLDALTAKSEILFVQTGESIQAVLDTSSFGDTVLVENGVYHESLVLSNHSVVLSSRYILSNDSSDILTTILMPDPIQSDTASCIAVVSGNQIQQTIIGFTLQNGTGTVTDILSHQRSGGGVYARYSCVSIQHCRIINCEAGFGGGIAAIGPTLSNRSGFVEVNYCDIRDCNALENGGGINVLSCSLVVRSSSLTNDSCFHFAGGLEARHSYVSANDVTIDSAYGLWSSLASINCEIFLDRCTFRHGSSPENPLARSHFNIGGSAGRVSGCIFSDNISPMPCGSIYGDTAPEVIGCIFERNTATYRTATVLLGYDDNTQFAYNIIRDNVNSSGGALQPFQRTIANIHHNLITGNRSLNGSYPSAIMCVSGCNPTLEFNRIENNEGISTGFSPNSEEHPWSLINNWWGSESGPYHETLNPLGEGDTIVSAFIDFSPWLLSPPDISSNGQTRPDIAQTWEVLSVFPNPFNSSFAISIAGFAGKDFHVELFDLLGRHVDLIHAGPFTGNTLRYSAPSHLSSGIYFLTLRDKRQLRSHKIVFLK